MWRVCHDTFFCSKILIYGVGKEIQYNLFASLYQAELMMVFYHQFGSLIVRSDKLSIVTPTFQFGISSIIL